MKNECRREIPAQADNVCYSGLVIGYAVSRFGIRCVSTVYLGGSFGQHRHGIRRMIAR